MKFEGKALHMERPASNMVTFYHDIEQGCGMNVDTQEC